MQAHMDMVPQKAPDSKHNFETDPIKTIIDGDWVRANHTTLGSDDGLGVATIMAVMESKDLQHGPIEGLITADEETGMYGANDLPTGELNGDILLNFDTEV
jgi:dipeptidase D